MKKIAIAGIIFIGTYVGIAVWIKKGGCWCGRKKK